MSPSKEYTNDSTITEIGVDEAGRGPMFGRVYSAAVILPKDDSFDHSKMKDSKKFHSKKKILETAEYIKNNCIAYEVSYSDENYIDKHNIRQATFKAMHNAIEKVVDKSKKNYILVDGNDFRPFTYMEDEMLRQIPHVCVIGGDNAYSAIAAASILAKVSRDKYIDELCKENELLDKYYDLNKNKGYGTKKHMDGIKEYGISKWHRKTYGICRNVKLNDNLK